MWSFFASMVLGQAVMLATAVIAARDAGRPGLLPWVLALPIYWPLGAVAAWRAIAEIFYPAVLLAQDRARGQPRRPAQGAA